MKGQKLSWLSMNRFARAGMAALIVLMLAGAARADIVKFDVFGTAFPSRGTLGSCAAGTICSFSGTMMVDVTAGVITAYDITFPGLPPFNNCCLSQAPFIGSVFFTESINNAGQHLQLFFFTTHDPASLVGFAGGSIVGGGRVFDIVPGLGEGELYSVTGGEITPVPEPSSLALLSLGLTCCLGYGLVRRRSKAALISRPVGFSVMS